MNAELDPRAARAASALHLSAEGIDPYGRLHDLRRLERRRSRVQVVAAFALLVALVAAGMLARRYDPPAVGPLPSLATIAVGRQPTGMAVGRGALWVMNQGSGTRLADRPRRRPGGGDRAGGATSADAIAVGRDAVWVGGWSRDQGDVVRRIDPRTNRVMATVPVASEPTGLAVTDDAVWATSLVGGTVTRIDPRTNRVVATIETGGRPVHVAADDRSVWVAYPLDTLVKADRPADQQGGGDAPGRPAPGRGRRLRLGVGGQRARPRSPAHRPLDRSPDGRGRRPDQGGRGAGVPRRRARTRSGSGPATRRSSGSTRGRAR